MKAPKKPAKSNLLTGLSQSDKKPVTRRMGTVTGDSNAGSGPEVEWWKLSTKELSRIADQALRGLSKNADAGDLEAARALVNLAWSTSDLQDASWAKQLIRSYPFWPMLLPANGKKRKEAIAEITALGFGKDCELNVCGKYDEGAPVTKVALKIYGLLANVRKTGRPGLPIFFNGEVTDEQQIKWRKWVNTNATRLPKRLEKENAREWADLTEPVLKIFWGGEYENHPQFATYRNSSAYNGTNKKRLSPAKPSSIRDAIRKTWRQSWESIANPRLDTAIG